MRFAFVLTCFACVPQPKLNPDYARWSKETSAPPREVKSDWDEQIAQQNARGASANTALLWMMTHGKVK